MHMCVRKLRILKNLVPGIQKLTSIAWRKLLAAISIFGTAALVFWPRHTYLEVLTWRVAENKSLIENFTSNLADELFKIQQTMDSSIKQRIASSYCQTKGCKDIACSSIPEDTDPGAAASDFIENHFKVECKDAKSVKLSFDDCKFSANTLRRNWLRTSVSIEELTFNSCYLSEIEDSVFSSPIYESTKKIAMVNNKIVSLRKAMFRHLVALEALTIQANIIRLAEFNLLQHVADSLTTLELYGVIYDREVLRNITGGDVLSKLQILSIRGNSISMIDAELFAGVPAVISLYLDGSRIRTVSPDTLKPIGSRIQKLILNNNHIQVLPASLLDPILPSKRPFCMAIHDNPWHCDCNLKWMQDLIKSHPGIILNTLTCSTPQVNAGKTFTTAVFCNQSIPSTVPVASTTPGDPIETTKHDWSHVNETTTQRDYDSTPKSTTGITNVVCKSVYTFLGSGNSRKLLSSDFRQFHSRFPNFYVSSYQDKYIVVNLPDLVGVTLLWFNNDDVEGSLSCAKNVKHSYLMQNIDPQSTYTICLLRDNEDTVSPLNCLSAATKPANEFRTWLTNADKSLVFALLIFSLVLLFLFGGFLSFLLIRKHPTLLRGSKRVVLVKQRNVEAIVLPKGVNINEEKRGQGNVAYGGKTQEDGYVTPIPPVRILLPRGSMVSRMSSQSDVHSYVSEVEPMETMVDYWRLGRVKNEIEKHETDAPPLPPHRCQVIPSLSLAVDSMDEHHYQSSIA